MKLISEIIVLQGKLLVAGPNDGREFSCHASSALDRRHSLQLRDTSPERFKLDRKRYDIAHVRGFSAANAANCSEVTNRSAGILEEISENCRARLRQRLYDKEMRHRDEVRARRRRKPFAPGHALGPNCYPRTLLDLQLVQEEKWVPMGQHPHNVDYSRHGRHVSPSIELQGEI